MTDPIIFSDKTARFSLPLLYAAQAQKEIFVNEAHAITDALLHCRVEDIVSAPPTTPNDGQNWLVGPAATGDFAGHDDAIACRQEGQWLFVSPVDGMRIYDATATQERRFSGTWIAAADIASPSGGATVDSQARTAIGEIISALRDAGIIPST